MSDRSGRVRLVVLVSGSGTNLQALLDASHCGDLPADIVGVVSNRTDAFGLERARRVGVDAHALTPAPGEARSGYDARLAEVVSGFRPDVVVLAGWMRILTMPFLGRFPSQVINLHPALPGELPGVNAIERAFTEHRAGTRRHTGVMVHLVPDEGVDDGPVLATATVPISPDDTVETLAERVHSTEHRLLVETVKTWCDERERHRDPDRHSIGVHASLLAEKEMPT